MDIHRAISLAEFINQQNRRFAARVLDFSDQGWVIVQDTGDDLYLEPITDAAEYVRRAGQGEIALDTACRDLLTAWVSEDI